MVSARCQRRCQKILFRAGSIMIIIWLMLQAPTEVLSGVYTATPQFESNIPDESVISAGAGQPQGGHKISPDAHSTSKQLSLPSSLAGKGTIAAATVKQGTSRNPDSTTASQAPSSTTQITSAAVVELREQPSTSQSEHRTISEPARIQSSQSHSRNCTIFTFWNFPRKPLYAQLDVESWRRHAHGFCDGPILLNETNVKQWIPDMPDEFFQLPYEAAKSDMVRYGALYHNGGLYFDSDFIVVKNLTDILIRLPQYDLISYETSSAAQKCHAGGTFSSNFMGGRKGSRIHEEIWKQQKAALTKHCQTQKEYKSEKICCMDDKKVQCHIPWAQLGEGISHRALGSFVKKTRDALRQGKDPAEINSPTMFCFGKEESFVPSDFTIVLNQKPQLKQALSMWKDRKEKFPMDRIAYHLFNANSGVQSMSRKELFDTKTVLGTLYTRSFDDSVNSGEVSAQLLKADSALLGGARKNAPKMRPYSKIGNGGCYHHRDRDTCCKYKDGRTGEPFEGQDCVPSKPGKTMNGNMCEPEGWEDTDNAGTC